MPSSRSSADLMNAADWLQMMIAYSGAEAADRLMAYNAIVPYQPPPGVQTYCEQDATETFYRTMSEADFQILRETGNIPSSGETFISQSGSYASNYNGVLVKFSVAKGTTDALRSIGVRARSNLTAQYYN